ncbi:MAG: LPS export ABC transporter ATP-binding protein [Xanthomonadales bacterium]|nr:LPS export ABC transporter ATP-binding protein [Xanthomonadales bacterium]
MLRAEGISKAYKGRRVVDQCSLQVSQGETVGLLGPNGAGKTTCFYMVVGLVPCESGAISLDDEDITRTPMHLRAKGGIGYLPQEPSVFRRLTVRDNIMAVLELRKGLSRAERRKQMADLMDELQIRHLGDQRGISLSGGERRRVEIARALAAAPRFMLLDEPFAGVDPISVGEIKRIVRHLKSRNIGVLVTDHNVRETLDICDRAYILNQGRVLAQGEPESLLNDPQVRQVYLGDDFQM